MHWDGKGKRAAIKTIALEINEEGEQKTIHIKAVFNWDQVIKKSLSKLRNNLQKKLYYVVNGKCTKYDLQHPFKKLCVPSKCFASLLHDPLYSNIKSILIFLTCSLCEVQG